MKSFKSLLSASGLMKHVKLWKSQLNNCLLIQKMIFHWQQACQQLKLIEKRDWYHFLLIEQKIQFINKKKLQWLMNNKQVKFLVFSWSEYLNEFANYHQEIVYVTFYDWQYQLLQLDYQHYYIIIGSWRLQMEYYRFLKYHQYHVYLHPMQQQYEEAYKS